jgi:hypothetical protein
LSSVLRIVRRYHIISLGRVEKRDFHHSCDKLYTKRQVCVIMFAFPYPCTVGLGLLNRTYSILFCFAPPPHPDIYPIDKDAEKCTKIFETFVLYVVLHKKHISSSQER